MSYIISNEEAKKLDNRNLSINIIHNISGNVYKNKEFTYIHEDVICESDEIYNYIIDSFKRTRI